MSLERGAIFEWAAAGRLPRERVERALSLAGATPDAAAWRRFLDRLLLGGGVLLAASGVIFFVAANWQALGRFAKFGLVEAPIAVAIAVCVWRGLDSTVGRVALLAAALCTGALLALVGQTYQTGADTYELAAAWALAILAWVAVARFPALWLLWLAIVNLGVALYFETFGRWLGIVFGTRESLWALSALDTIALAVWEALAATGVAWLRARWAIRVLVAASGTAITTLAAWGAARNAPEASSSLLVYVVWLGAIWWFYRRRAVDLFVLAGASLSAVVVVTFWLARWLLPHDASGLLLIAVMVIAGAALCAWWLRTVAAEERT